MSSSDSAPETALALVVPIDVAALCLGEIDATEVAPNLAGATAAFDEQVTEAHQAFIGANVSHAFDDPPWHSLEEGIHIHWALPDALTRASSNEQGHHEFPAVPNRWLVTRTTIADGALVTRSWLVQSDLVLEEPPDGQAPVTVAVSQGTFANQEFGWLGVATDVTDGWQPPDGPARSIGETTGTPLTAVANGEVSFAAFYPSSRSAFGFHDNSLAEIKPPPGETASVSYTVLGWYDTPAADPVQPGATVEQLRERQRWTYTGAGAPSFSIYCGLVQGLEWSPETRYLEADPPPVTAQAAIGSTPTEALSAHFAKTEQPQTPLFEQLLDGFQLGLLDNFMQPEPDQLAGIAGALHDESFARTPPHAIFTVTVPDPGMPGEGTREVVELPPALAADLNLLNELTEQLNRCSDHIAWYRWQVFADWYRIFEANEDTENAAISTAYQRVANFAELADALAPLAAQLQQQREVVERQLPAPMKLSHVPASPYVRPADPVVALSGEQMEFPQRHGGDGRYDPDGYLLCRLGNDLLSSLTAGGKQVTPASLAGLLAPAGIPKREACTALLRDCALLDSAVLAPLTGVAAAALDAALRSALAGEAQSVVTLAGTPPSPVEVGWWEREAWRPLMLGWEVEYLPFHETEAETAPAAYPPPFVNANFVLGQDTSGTLQPVATSPVDPAKPHFPQHYAGSALLTPTAATNLQRRLGEYLAEHTDRSLEAILHELEATNVVTGSLSGLTELTLMRRPGMQLGVRVPSTALPAIIELTKQAAAIIGGENTIAPAFNAPFNPLRAGYARVSLKLVDGFGRKRAVSFPELACSAPMVAHASGGPVASTAYLAPRLSQPSRLILRWLAADGTELEEMNSHPATSPICGWLQPNRLDGSLFLYSGEGSALGTIYLQQEDKGSRVGWQSAPGDERTIDQDVATALAAANAQLRELAISLVEGDAEFFKALWRVIDAAGDAIAAGTPGSNTGTAALVGNPVAIAQAMVRVELQGHPLLDLGWDAFASDQDDGLTEVRLPVVLGDAARLDDGLIGWFAETPEKPVGTYDLSTFFAPTANPAATGGVVRPNQETLTVTPAPNPDVAEPADLAPATRTVLMLAYPTVAVHATTGLLPGAELQLPPDRVGQALSRLDFSFFIAPILRGADALALPIPAQAGYAASWIEERRHLGDANTWEVTPSIATPAAGVWAYTPQTLTEGWLRLNPIVLEFLLEEAHGQPIVKPGPGNELTLRIVNNGLAPASFAAGPTVPRGTQSSGSIFYVELAALVAQNDIGSIELASPDWAFTLYTDSVRGAYWAAAPVRALTLEPGAQLTIAVSSLTVTAGVGRSQVVFSYAAVEGMDDGVYVDTLAVQTNQAIAR